MAALKFASSHNMVAFLHKPTESDGLEQIVDFLNAHPIKYALTIQALVDKKKVIITETSIISDLQLEDAKVTVAKITTARRVSTVRKIKTRERIKMKIPYQDYLLDNYSNSSLDKLKGLAKTLKSGSPFRPDSELYEALRPYQRWKLDFPKSQPKKTNKEDSEYGMVRVGIPSCMLRIDFTKTHDRGDQNMMEDKVENPSP
ncbi:hypothetical protein Tco_0752802 [Tanacetum coccineum]|uniref:Uncharacterized protein n=1 Tax=Tanacetum coccineum TaxID=301880 RepID=A0ABQ4Z9M2_9ASTR